MSIEKLQQDILRCQYVVSEITIKHYQQDNYKEIVMKIFKDILGDYFTDHAKIKGLHADNKCPDKLEPTIKPNHLPPKALKKIQEKYGINRSEE